MKVLLVAGHGAGDPGAVGNGYKEADLTREMAAKIKGQLEKSIDTDIFDMSRNLYQVLKNGGTVDFSKYDYILEIHFNAGISGAAKNDGKTTGTEIYVHEKQANIFKEQCIVENIAKLGFKNRGVKRRSNFQNMNIIHKKGKAYALLEICFIDDSDDMRLYGEKKDLIAKAVADGIRKGFGIMELTTVNDIVWELSQRGIISDKNLWLKKLQEDQNAYWLARKCVNYIISRH